MAINHGSLSANLTPRGVVGGRVQNSVLAYENDYENLINKPSINDTELNGDLSLEDLGIVNNVQPDWGQTDTEAGDYINNKPDIPENLSDLNDDADHRTVSDTEKTTWNNKSDFSGSYNDLTDKPVIPDAQIQSDWNQNDNTKADYIKNKPSIPSAQVQSDWNESDSSKADFIKNKPSIPTALADLTDDSTHRTVTDTEKTAWNSGEANVQSNWNETDTTSDAYIQNKPSIPSVTANPGSTTATLSSIGIDGTNYAISGGSGGGAVDSVNGQTGIVVLDAEDVGALPDDTPLFSGDYEDLTNKPTIPDDLADLNDDSTHRLVTDTEKTTWNGKSDFSGSYNDLSNKPTLGTASALDVPVSGNASTSQVVKGDDSRLTDARTPVSHTHTTSDITDFPTMSDYIQKSNTSGLVKNDGTIDTNSYATTSQIPDISGKADKVSGATNGNLAGLDANGNLTDAGWASDKTSTSVTGNPISISGLKSNQLAKDPIITLEPIQAGSGDPSPSNVRAISGYDKIEVLSLRKNLFDENKLIIGYFNDSGWHSDNQGWCGVAINTNPGDRIIPSGIETAGGVYVVALKDVNNFTGGYTILDNSAGVNNLFTTPDGYHGIWIPMTSASNKSAVQIEYGTSATAYEPYNPITDIQLTLGQTVYGGTLDVEKGILTVVKVKMKLKDLVWESYTNPDTNILYFYSRTIHYTGKISPPKSNGIYCLCNKYNRFTGIEYMDIPNNSCVLGLSTWSSSSSDFVIRDNRYSSISDFTDSLTDDDIVVYQYVTENTYTIQLTPHEISLLKDYAYVSTNGTNIQFSYKNGEMASLGDVAQLGQTVNELGDRFDNLSTIPNGEYSWYGYFGASQVALGIGTVGHEFQLDLRGKKITLLTAKYFPTDSASLVDITNNCTLASYNSFFHIISTTEASTVGRFGEFKIRIESA